MEVEARIVYWTAEGMKVGEPPPGHDGYIERREVERLLEQVHRRAWEASARACAAEVQRA
jgi:hypothetical protein